MAHLPPPSSLGVIQVLLGEAAWLPIFIIFGLVRALLGEVAWSDWGFGPSVWFGEVSALKGEAAQTLSRFWGSCTRSVLARFSLSFARGPLPV